MYLMFDTNLYSIDIAVTLPEIAYDLETSTYDVLTNRQTPNILKEIPPVAVTFAVFDE